MNQTLVFSMRKKDVFSIFSNRTRLTILKRLGEAEKAAYSDIMDSVDHIQPLNSTGNLNYHLNFLLRNEVIRRDGSVYRLTDDGRRILAFMLALEEKWYDLQKELRGDMMSVISIAEHFEEEVGITMMKEVIEFMGMDLIMDEKQTFGILGVNPEVSIQGYSLLDLDSFGLKRVSYKSNEDEERYTTLLVHPDLRYELSPKWFGVIQNYLDENYGGVFVYARKDTPAPFLISSHEFESDEIGCVFVIAPSVVDKEIKEKIKKES